MMQIRVGRNEHRLKLFICQRKEPFNVWYRDKTECLVKADREPVRKWAIFASSRVDTTYETVEKGKKLHFSHFHVVKIQQVTGT